MKKRNKFREEKLDKDKEKEDLNNKNSINDYKKEGEMAKKRGSTRRKTKKPAKKRVGKAKFKWW